MARQTVRTTVRTTNTQTRVRNDGSSGSKYRQCNMCKGSGVVRVPNKRSNKK